jgi:hypothetical protein
VAKRGFAPMHIYHVASCTPVVAILRPERTPKGTEVRTVIRHVTKRLRKHWPNTRIVWRGDGHYRRVEEMERVGSDGPDYIFGLAGNPAHDALMAETRRQSALPSCREQSDQAARLCELLLSGRQLGSCRQGGGAAGVLVGAGRRRGHRNRHAPGGGCPDFDTFYRHIRNRQTADTQPALSRSIRRSKTY